MPISLTDFDLPPDVTAAERSAGYDPARPFLFEGLEPRYATRVISSVFMPMRDGVRLSTDFHIPLGAKGPLPVILMRTPYSKDRTALAQVRVFSEQGFVVAAQDVRGRHESEGIFSANTAQDREDGYDTVEWLVAQPWCSGAVGAIGSSYVGETAAKLAATRHPAHRCTVLMFDGAYAGRDSLSGAFIQGGVLVLEPLFEWCRSAVPTVSYGPPPHIDRAEWFSKPYSRAYATQPVNLPPIDMAEALRTLPVTEMMERSGGAPSIFEAWAERSVDPADPYWAGQGFLTEADTFHTPTIHITGPRERGGSGFDNFRLFRTNGVDARTQDNQRLWFTPALHSAISLCQENEVHGARSFGDTRDPYYSRLVAWFGHWLRDDPLPEGPAVRYYLAGANQWREAETWPPRGCREHRLFLNSDGLANSRLGDGRLGANPPEAAQASDTYLHDPAHPVPSAPADQKSSSFLGSYVERSEIELRADLLVYTSEPMIEPLRLVGPMRAELFVSSDAPDTDVVAILTEVDEAGRSIDIMHGVLRARFRDGLDAPRPLSPGEIARLEVDLWHAAVEIPAGHRLRLTVASSFFPFYARNLGFGENDNTSDRMRTARNTLHHDPEHPSALVLTILP